MNIELRGLNQDSGVTLKAESDPLLAHFGEEVQKMGYTEDLADMGRYVTELEG